MAANFASFFSSIEGPNLSSIEAVSHEIVGLTAKAGNTAIESLAVFHKEHTTIVISKSVQVYHIILFFISAV
jgi:hypothetical protein